MDEESSGVGRRHVAEVRSEVAGEGAPITAAAQEAAEDEGGGGDGDPSRQGFTQTWWIP